MAILNDKPFYKKSRFWVFFLTCLSFIFGVVFKADPVATQYLAMGIAGAAMGFMGSDGYTKGEQIKAVKRLKADVDA